MHFGFDDEQLAMRDAVRSLCEKLLDRSTVSGREGRPAEPELWSALADVGVLDVLGGVGIVEAVLAFEELGAHLTTGPVLWSALAAPLVAGAGSGGTRVTGLEAAAAIAGCAVVPHFSESDALLVLHDDRVECCRSIDLGEAEPGSPLDPLTPVGVLDVVPSGEVVGGIDAAGRLRRQGRILGAAMLVGTARASLELASDYALQREQFGVRIGSFQAIKHILADMFVRLELARAATYAAAAIEADGRAGDTDHAAATAMLLAGEAGLANGRAAVQVFGGMGFTWEMLPHYYLKRAWVLEQWFGGGSAHAAELAAQLGRDVAQTRGD